MLLKTAKFYGWTLEYVKGLPIDEFNKAWDAITVIEAQDMLVKMSIAEYPNLDGKNKSARHKKIYKLAYPNTFKKRKVLSTKDLAGMLGKG